MDPDCSTFLKNAHFKLHPLQILYAQWNIRFEFVSEVAEELDAPRKALEEKWASYCAGAVEDSRVPLTPMWTPAMQMMTSELPQVTYESEFSLSTVLLLQYNIFRLSFF